jgi:hypothetical protein
VKNDAVLFSACRSSTNIITSMTPSNF